MSSEAYLYLEAKRAPGMGMQQTAHTQTQPQFTITISRHLAPTIYYYYYHYQYHNNNNSNRNLQFTTKTKTHKSTTPHCEAQAASGHLYYTLYTCMHNSKSASCKVLCTLRRWDPTTKQRGEARWRCLKEQ